MQFVMFSKHVQDLAIEKLGAFAHSIGIDGYDLCVRPGFPVNPENVAEALPRAVATLHEHGLTVPMLTGNFDLLEPEHPTARPILHAMAETGVGLLKIGYVRFDTPDGNYPREVETPEDQRTQVFTEEVAFFRRMAQGK